MEEKGFLSSLISKKYGETKMIVIDKNGNVELRETRSSKVEHKTKFPDYKGRNEISFLDLENEELIGELNKRITTPRLLERFFKSSDLEPIGWEFEYDEEYGVDFINLWDGLEDPWWDVDENGNRIITLEDMNSVEFIDV
tara:strand:+ start:417 stop:836 length:420 start_codon:yes stop_codon:yes gene_type:complete